MEQTSLLTIANACAAGALVLAALLTPPVLILARRLGAVDRPSLRRMHQGEIPRLGGIAIYLAYAAVLLTLLHFGSMGPRETDSARFLAFLGGATVITIVGIADDMRGLGAKKKILGQILAATIAWAFEVRINPVLGLPYFGLTDFGIFFSYLATVIWILAITNAINLIDGLDGLAAGVVFFAAVTNMIVGFVSDNVIGVALNATLAGATLGFLFYNFKPAKIFMGDTGSLFLGYALAAGALISERQKESTLASLMVPMIALGLPLTDTVLAMLRRVIARRSIFSADREHVHHRLVDLGIDHGRAVLILYGLSIMLCATSVGFAMGRDWQVGAALFGTVFVVGGIVRLGGSLQDAIRARRQKKYTHIGSVAHLVAHLPRFVLDANTAATRLELFSALDQLLEKTRFPQARLAKGTNNVWARTPSKERAEGTPHQLSFVLPDCSEFTLHVTCLTEQPSLPASVDALMTMASQVLCENLVRVTQLEDPAKLTRSHGQA